MYEDLGNKYLYMVWGALCAICQFDGTTETTPSPTVLAELKSHDWDELTAAQAIRYLVMNTKPLGRSSSLVAWVGARADAREVKA